VSEVEPLKSRRNCTDRGFAKNGEINGIRDEALGMGFLVKMRRQRKVIFGLERNVWSEHYLREATPVHFQHRAFGIIDISNNDYTSFSAQG
jgi:hypothetical protein